MPTGCRASTRVEAEGGNTPDKAKRRLFMADGGVVDETLTRWDAEKMMLGVHREGDDVKRLPAVNYTTHCHAAPGRGRQDARRMEGAASIAAIPIPTRRRSSTTTSPSPP